MTLIAVVAMVACGDDARVLRRWTLACEGCATTEVTLPAHVEDRLAHRGDRFHLRTTVVLPPALRGREVTVAIPFLMARAELAVDGRRLASQRAFYETVRSTAHAWHVPSDVTAAGTLDLELTIEDSWFQSTYLDVPPRLHAGPSGGSWYEGVTAFNHGTAAFAVAVTLLLGGLYVMLFLGRRRATYGFISAQAFCIAFYPALLLGLLQWPLGRFDVQIGGMMAGLAGIASIGYTHAMFELPRPSRVWWVLAAIQVVAHVACDPFSLRWSGALFGAVVLCATFAYQVIVHVRLLRGRAPPVSARLGLAAWALLAVLGGSDLAAWAGIGEVLGGLRTTALGIAGFVAIQTIALGREHLDLTRRLDEANQELRRQVNQRSRQLAHALSALASAAPGRRQPAIGDVIDDRYRIEEHLGSGAMGAVFRVTRLEDGRAFAMKVLLNPSDAVRLARFAREAHLASEVVHEHIVTIHDVDFSSAGFVYLVMELVDGQPLSLRRDELREPAAARSVLCQIAEGLAAIHRQGVVHRDLKPDNILVTRRDGGWHVKIADFGVSGIVGEPVARYTLEPEAPPATEIEAGPEDVTRTIDRAEEAPPSTIDTVIARPGPLPAVSSAPGVVETEGLTQIGTMLGTPAYMAPELAHGDAGNAPGRDVFSVGVIGFELLTGRRPFRPAAVLTLLRHGRIAPPPRLRTIRPELDEGFAAAIDRALALDPSERPSASELAELLEAGP